MNAADFEVITIEFPDASSVEHDITRSVVQDGVLHLFHKKGQWASETHVASYPVVNVHCWRRRKRYP